jgi:L-lactate permease
MTAWQWFGVILAVLVIEVPWLWSAFWDYNKEIREFWLLFHGTLLAIALAYGIVALILGDWVPW